MDPEQEGGSMGVLTVSIASIVGMLVLIYVLWRVFFLSSEFADVQACRDSVQMNAASGIKGKAKLDAIRCPMKEVAVKTDNQAEAEILLADEMAECWYKFGEGRQNLFLEISDNKASYCALCAIIKPEDKAKGLLISGFNTFLSNNRVPEKYLKAHDGPMLYVDFMKTFDTTKQAGGDNRAYLDSIGRMYSNIRLTDSYATVYVHKKTGSSDWVASVELIPFKASEFEPFECKYMPVAQENFLKEEDRTGGSVIGG